MKHISSSLVLPSKRSDFVSYQDIRKIILAFCGGTGIKQVKPGKSGLIVQISNPIIASELRLAEPRILREIESRTGRKFTKLIYQA